MDEETKYQKYEQYGNLVTQIAKWQLDKIRTWNPEKCDNSYVRDTRKRLSRWQDEAERELEQICNELGIRMPPL